MSAGPVVILDQVVASGALSPSVVSSVIRFPALTHVQVHHAGFGASAAGVIQGSDDGVNWDAGAALTLTATTPTTLHAATTAGPNVKFWRAVITHGGANGGRIVISVVHVPAEPEYG